MFDRKKVESLQMSKKNTYNYDISNLMNAINEIDDSGFETYNGQHTYITN